MCLYGTLKYVSIINKQNKSRVVVDACIAEEIQQLNNLGVVTLGCCCKHGLAGQIAEHENAYGLWKERRSPPECLIHEGSIGLAKELGYTPIPYIYADGLQNEVWEIYLKSGCITEDECKKWHIDNDVPFVMHYGVIGEG